MDGKFAHPESSAALAANALGLFLDDAEPVLEALGLPVSQPASLRLEQCLRFPWRGGLHPWLDAVIETPDLLVGIESKRYEPFRGAKPGLFSDSYFRPVWGDGLDRFQAQRDAIAAGIGRFERFDAAQLVKHAFGIATQARRRGKRAVLVYLHAEPCAWPGERPIAADRIALHRAERDRFASSVEGDLVTFLAVDYVSLLSRFKAMDDGAIRVHAQAVEERFSPL
ncbi:hypothetical protein ABMA46_01685 [Mesorhizobium sp. CN5-321]|uniref:hypothetical protein n=1 Tax=Mesorhizobium hunchu TaxID=3157708 RepID=UPI0032B70697